MPKAINMKSKFYAYAKSTEVQGHELVIINNSTEEIVSTFDFVPTDFPRKTIINVEFVDTINNSSACYKNQNKKKHLTKLIKLEKNSSLIIKSGSIKHSMDDLNLECGEHELNIYHFIDTPLIAKEESQPSRLELIKNSEILNIYIIISKEHGGQLSEVKKMSFYESYGELGFIVTDIERMSKFIKESTRVIDNDLFKEFTTTELASELFDNGIMMLCWGMTPWPYFITSEDTNKMRLPLPKGHKTSYIGQYKFSSEIQDASIIPGNALSNWALCCEKNWPKLKISGESEFASIELHIIDALSQNTNSGHPIPTFFISRDTKNNGLISPLLYSKIL
jgi:hypothetical protein